MNKRLGELDSLRGLAAFTVLIHHFLLPFAVVNGSMSYPAEYYLENSSNLTKFLIAGINYTPLYVLRAGHEAVIFFFILSGFVLALPFLNETASVSYPEFITKRVCRIYIPYIVAITVAIGANDLFYRGGIDELSRWFNSVGQSPIDINLVIKHLLFIDSFTNYMFDPVIWSLIHEMRISIIFPLIMYFIINYNWRISLITGFLLGIFGFYTSFLLNQSTDIYTIRYDYFVAISFIPMFVIGALLAKNRHRIISRFIELHRYSKCILFVIALIMYINSIWLNYAISSIYKGQIFLMPVIKDWLISVGAVIFILLALSSKSLSNVLRKKPIHFIGKISYSIYLYHSICLIASINILFGKAPLLSIIIIAFIATIILSTLSYFFVEVPSISLGRYLTRSKPKISESVN